MVKYLSEQCEICLQNLQSKTILLAVDELSSVGKKPKKTSQSSTEMTAPSHHC